VSWENVVLQQGMGKAAAWSHSDFVV